MYFYDASGSVIGMQYHGADYATNVWDIYWFEKNIFGDVIAVYDEYGTKLISYVYGAYGEHETQYYNSGSTTTAVNNPFRYRGYYYDNDLNLYYLNARYYDSNTSRFINVDSALYHSMLGYNMYTYCYNNPVMYFDPTGRCAGAMVGGSIVTIIETAYTIVGIVIIIGCVIYIAENFEDIIDDNKSKTSPKSESPTKPDVNDDAPSALDPPSAGETDSSESSEPDAKDKTKPKLPTISEPNTDEHEYDNDGIKRTRHYGSDGKAEYDIDYRHSGEKHTFPHRHNWTWPDGKPIRGGAIKIF